MNHYDYILKLASNYLFVILDLILIIVYFASENLNKKAYFVLGYLAVAFALLITINGLMRVCLLSARKYRELINSESEDS